MTIRPTLLIYLVCCCLFLSFSVRAESNVLLADLSSRLIAVTSSFDGARLLLFGTAIEALSKDNDLVVVVRGPDKDFTIRQKEQSFGLWVNQGWAEFQNAPSFYFVVSSRPLEEIAKPEILHGLGIGLDSLKFRINSEEAEDNKETYDAAMLRLQSHLGLYGVGLSEISILEDRLFRTDILLPNNVPVGFYNVEVFLFQKGNLIGDMSTGLTVFHAGLEAEIIRFAYDKRLLYGLLVIILSMVLGWTADLIFRRYD